MQGCEVSDLMKWEAFMGGNILKYEGENIVATPIKWFEKWSENPLLDQSSLVSMISQRMAELTLAVGALAQGQQSFTHAAPMAAPAPQAGTEAASFADDIRKLSQRMDDLEARVAKG
jgi:hypothetical protein